MIDSKTSMVELNEMFEKIVRRLRDYSSVNDFKYLY